ncbi:SDR family oxidoreductase [Mesorhizobium sp. M3A.F.Ca.ET.201.01.1.1]|uniref:SDR family NAD(P)-dependent oxidoreductase n=1 Tax=Mesorhizobium sp. M3A.F.Ca.ET.201.01.1.1 TaxID=2563946 RepID=UPI001093E537|nr:SDR family oxidoreductase [Mesorhizobium sp. M3A.F.Ca.ET.201.01.1.1]TGS71724.1 SDR family oxidoreductase [Mesorhizobium sp. M3A.F.Ca.ET.201.01.1.1]
MKRLAGRIAIVTGGAGGVGSAITALFVSEGAKVAIFDSKDTAPDALAALGEAAVRYYKVDITDEGVISAAISNIAAEWGVPDVLINAAAIAGSGKPTHEATVADFDAVFSVNVKGTFLCTKHVIAGLLAVGQPGSIVNISSTYGVIGNADIPLYHGTKAAVRLLSKCDAVTYAGNGIRSNSVVLGSTRTEMTQRAMEESAEGAAYVRKLIDAHPMKRQADPIEIARVALFLASDESSFVTGADIAADGGYTAQ